MTAANATVGATYTNNAQTFTVLDTITAGTLLQTTGTGDPLSSGTLTSLQAELVMPQLHTHQMWLHLKCRGWRTQLTHLELR